MRISLLAGVPSSNMTLPDRKIGCCGKVEPLLNVPLFEVFPFGMFPGVRDGAPGDGFDGTLPGFPEGGGGDDPGLV
jgi:hypothetical protein